MPLRYFCESSPLYDGIISLSTHTHNRDFLLYIMVDPGCGPVVEREVSELTEFMEVSALGPTHGAPASNNARGNAWFISILCYQ